MKKVITAISMVAVLSVAQAAGVAGAIRYDVTNSGSGTGTGVSKSEVTFTGTEDLGGGLSATATLGLNGLARGATQSGTDASIALTSSTLGTLKLGQIELANGIMGRGLGGAPVIGADGVVLAANVNADIVSYTGPAIGGFQPTVSSTRAVGSTGPRSNSIGLSGKVSSVDAGIDYNADSKRVRVSGSVNVVGVTVGAGWSGRETGVADTKVYGVSLPMGPLTVGAARSNGNGVANEFGAKYALSKRTNVQVAYRDVTGNSALASNVSTYRVRMEHAF